MRAPEDDWLHVTLPLGENCARLKIADWERTVEVRTPGGTPEIAILFETSPLGRVRIAEFEKQETTNRCIFKDVPIGEYYLAIGPRQTE